METLNRREVLSGAAAVAAAAVVPAVPPLRRGSHHAGHFVVRDMLTPDEIADLRRKAEAASAFYREAFGNLRMARGPEEAGLTR
jgi:hypothetical protein